MICKNCGNALGSEKATCPFCGALMQSEQIDSFLRMKRDREKDYRPRLVSERYGMEPIVYERNQASVSSWVFIVLGIVLVFAVIFLILVFIFF